VNGCQFLDGFQLDDQDSFHDQVRTETLVEPKATIFKRDRFLTFDAKAAFLQHSGQQCLVDRFEKARPKVLV
jgi:hypothetical protein